MTTSRPSTWQSLRAISHNAPMRRVLPILFSVFIFALIGCGDKQIQHARRPKRYQAVISLSPSSTEVIASNGDIQTLKGRTKSCNFPPMQVQSIPIVADVKPDYEKITSIHPDLIVFDKGLYSDQDIDKLKPTGAELFAFKANDVEGFVKELFELGSLLAFETRFNDYANRIEVEKASALADVYNPKPKVAILMPDASGADYIAGTDSFLADVIRICGGELVGPKGSQFAPLNAEAFVALNPDVVIVPGTKTDVSGVGQVLGDVRFKTVTAIKNQRVQPIEADVLLRKGQRVDMLIKAIHAVIAPMKK
jgi:ABC-type Fe3+-hydroxamate transport system substrate-binding protein